MSTGLDLEQVERLIADLRNYLDSLHAIKQNLMDNRSDTTSITGALFQKQLPKIIAAENELDKSITYAGNMLAGCINVRKKIIDDLASL